MAWIQGDQRIRNHPKTRKLAFLMGWDVHKTVGALFTFWWWCVDYAEDGDLRRYSDMDIALGVELNAQEGAKFVKAMVESCWVDRQPYFRVHDWWTYIGAFLRKKYNSNPDKWKKVQQLYSIVDPESTQEETEEYSTSCKESTPRVLQEYPKSTPEKITQDKLRDASSSLRSEEAAPQGVAAYVKAVNDKGLNIYALLGHVRKKFGGRKVWFPDKVVSGVCQRYLQEHERVGAPWPWFCKVLKLEAEMYYADQEQSRGAEWKKEKVAVDMRALIDIVLSGKGDD